MTHRVHAFTLMVVTTATAMIAGCGSRAESPVVDTQPALAVAIARVGTAALGDSFEAGGLVEARTTAVLSARILAPVRELRVKAGDRVSEAQVLVVLDGTDLAARSRGAMAAAAAGADEVRAAISGQREADAALALASITHARVKELHGKRSATQEELDNATAALTMAEARAQGAAARLAVVRSTVEGAEAARDAAATMAGFATIAAPFDGVVTATLVEVGNMAAPGQPLVRVEDIRNLRLAARIDESRLDAAVVGARVPVALDGGADGAVINVDGDVSEVARVDDASAHVFLIKIALPAGTVVEPGRFGRARLTTRTRVALTLPDGALRQQGQIASVFIVDNGIARLRMVDVRGREVIAGVVDGEIVVVRPPADLTDGRRVTTGGTR